MSLFVKLKILKYITHCFYYNVSYDYLVYRYLNLLVDEAYEFINSAMKKANRDLRLQKIVNLI